MFKTEVFLKYIFIWSLSHETYLFFSISIYFVFQKYQLNIRYDQQPLLISKAKARNIRAGMSEHIILVPELCRLTGITDDMR